MFNGRIKVFLTLLSAMLFLSLISSCGASDAYRFPVALNVSKAYAVEETIQVSYYDGGIGIVEFRLEHTPQE